MNLIFLRKVFESAYATFLRFPFVLLSALGATAMGIYIVAFYPGSFLPNKLLFVFYLGVPLFLAWHLFNEVESSFYIRRYSFVGAAILLIIFFFTLRGPLLYQHYLRFIVLAISFHLLVSFAPYIHRQHTPSSFWHFNYEIFIRVLSSGFYALVFFIGLVIGVLALDQLFDLHIPTYVYLVIGISIIGLFGTSFFLSGIPFDFDIQEKAETYPQALKFFTRSVLLPLLGLYLLILYSYGLKILLEWQLPNGYVAYLIIIFAIAGIFSFLLIFPIQDETENRWINTFARWYYITLLPLIFLLFVAIGRRLSDYGLTELRYYVLIIAFWLLGITIFFLVKKVRRIQVIPISLSVLLFISSYGPISSFYLAKRSQLFRLDQLLSKNELLVNGKILTGDSPNMQFEQQDLREIRAILAYLDQRNQLNSLQPYFVENLDSLLQDEIFLISKEEKVLSLIGNSNLWDGLPSEKNQVQINFSSHGKDLVYSLVGYDYLISFEAFGAYSQSEEFYELYKQVYKLIRDSENNAIRLEMESNPSVLIDFSLNEVIQSLRENHSLSPHDIPQQEMTLIQESRSYKAKLVIENLGVRVISKSKNSLTGLSGKLLIKLY